MLSYQHAYHAGNRADIHKHSALARVLDILTRKDRPLTYMETHAGRGIYDLTSPEAQKTGEAGEGWQKLSAKDLEKLPAGYVGCVKALNGGKTGPFYPGSPGVAAYMLREQDQLFLMELHPQEYAALKKHFEEDKRVFIHKRDGLEGILALSPPQFARRGLVLIDPSYEVKEDYETIPAFVRKLVGKWPEASVLIWIPLLPAGRHDQALAALRKNFGNNLHIDKVEWGKPGEGMYGSIMVGINLPHGA